MRSYFYVPLCAILLFSGIKLNAQILTSKQIDSVAEHALRAFDVPGAAVAVIKDGKVIHAKGYGVRSLKTNQKVDENTLFGVASNTKAFTTAALAMLVDAQKITWNTKVITVIPEFKLYDSYVTNEFTIRDLITHRSGLGLGAGDLMIWPDSSTVDKKQLIHNLRYLKPVSSFRSKFDYDNLLYIVAGEVIERVSGLKYEDFIETKIMSPLGMNKSAMSFNRLKDKSNIIDAHAPVHGKIVAIPKDFTETSNAAGGINTSVTDLSKWVLTQLNGGKYGENLSKTLFSRRAQDQMWTLQTVIPNADRTYNSHFFGYGMGWFLTDEKGYLVAEHTGGLAGMVSQVTLVPELKLGIIVLTNQQVGEAFTALTNTIKDGYYGVKKRDWIKPLNIERLKQQKEAKTIVDQLWASINTQQSSASKVDIKNYVGTFNDPWFGEVSIREVNGKMYFQAKNSPKLRGDMTHYKDHTFIVKWYDRSLDADAFVNFNLSADGFKMTAISPLTDFSFDFKDLDFSRVDKNNLNQNKK